MTLREAYLIATLRNHFDCTFSKVGGLARLILGDAHCRKITGGHARTDSTLGQDLIIKMEDALQLERGESDTMTIAELVCLECHQSHYAYCYPDDTAKECGFCHQPAMVFPPTPSSEPRT